MKMLKLLQEMRGFAEVTNRRRISRHPGLFTIQLRSHLMQATNSRRKKLLVDMQEPKDIPHPVKIVYLNHGAARLPVEAV